MFKTVYRLISVIEDHIHRNIQRIALYQNKRLLGRLCRQRTTGFALYIYP